MIGRVEIPSKSTASSPRRAAQAPAAAPHRWSRSFALLQKIVLNRAIIRIVRTYSPAAATSARQTHPVAL